MSSQRELVSPDPKVRESALLASELARMANLQTSDPALLQEVVEPARALYEECSGSHRQYYQFASEMQGAAHEKHIKSDHTILDRIRVSNSLSTMLQLDENMRRRILDFCLKMETFLSSRV